MNGVSQDRSALATEQGIFCAANSIGNQSCFSAICSNWLATEQAPPGCCSLSLPRPQPEFDVPQSNAFGAGRSAQNPPEQTAESGSRHRSPLQNRSVPKLAMRRAKMPTRRRHRVPGTFPAPARPHAQTSAIRAQSFDQETAGGVTGRCPIRNANGAPQPPAAFTIVTMSH